MPRRLLLAAAAAIAVLGFVWTCYSLISAEVKQGNVYAPYSTLRTAPSGTRVLFDSLEDTGKTPKRNVLPLIHLFKEPPHTLVLMGISVSDLATLPKNIADGLDDFVKQGGHLVVSFPSNLKASGSDDDSDDSSTSPDESSSAPTSDDEDDTGEDNQPKVKHKASKDEDSISQEEYEKRRHQEIKDAIKKMPGGDADDFPDFTPSMLARWGFGIGVDSSKDPKDTFPDDSPAGAEAHLPWRSSIYFIRIDSAWHVLYRIEHRPVALSRNLGKGSISLLSDSYVFTNEAMKADRRVGFLSWILGGDDNPVFDETHLGVESDRGIASIISSLGFEGYIVGAFGVFLLYVWRNSSPLQPIQSDESADALRGAEGAVAGRDARSGLVNLLRRNIPEKNLIQVCLAEWKRSQMHGVAAQAAKIKVSEEISQKLPESEEELLASYRSISAVLNERKVLSKKP